jgi:hypothetical protein
MVENLTAFYLLKQTNGSVYLDIQIYPNLYLLDIKVGHEKFWENIKTQKIYLDGSQKKNIHQS